MLQHYTEPLISPVFICNVTKAVVLDTFFTAKERISMLWRFSHIFFCHIFVSLILCVITTLFQISSNLTTNYSNYKRCEVPKSFLIKRKQHQLKQPRWIIILIIVIIRINISDHLLTNIVKSLVQLSVIILRQLKLLTICHRFMLILEEKQYALIVC